MHRLRTNDNDSQICKRALFVSENKLHKEKDKVTTDMSVDVSSNTGNLCIATMAYKTSYIKHNETLYIYIYIYIYILSSIDRLFLCITTNSAAWRDTQDASSWDRKSPNFTLDLVSYRPAIKSTYVISGIITHFVLTFVCLHCFPFSPMSAVFWYSTIV